MSRSSTRRVVFQPAVYHGMQRGINQLANLIRPTLGARPRLIAIASTIPGRPPELLDDGGLIARRILQLPDPLDDVGTMFLRQVLTQLGDGVGDGTATAAVLFQLVYNQGVRYLVSGGDAIALRRHLEQGTQLVLDQLDEMTVPLVGRDGLRQLAESLCYDPELAAILSEILDIIGEFGQLDIQTGQRREVDREYVEGMYWERGAVARQMLVEAGQSKTNLDNAAILISDLEVEHPRQMVPLLMSARQANLSGLLLVAGSFSDSVVSCLLGNCKPGQFQLVAVPTPGRGAYEKMAALEDMAVLTGGRPILKATGASLERVTLGDLGHARRAWADRDHFGIAGGKGDARQLRAHLARLRAAFGRADDPIDRRQLQQRIGKLLGGSATLWVGGATPAEVERRKAVAERSAEALRGALREGTLPGGGAALLACRPAVRGQLQDCLDPARQAAYRILLRALEEPARILIANAGYDAADALAEINRAAAGYGLDVRSGEVVDMRAAGVLDAAAVQKAALRTALGAAGQALTIEGVVHHKPEQRTSQHSGSVQARAAHT